MNGTYSNRPDPPPLTLEDLRDTVAKLKQFPRLPSVIYVREDVWPEFEKKCVEAMTAVGQQRSAGALLEELLPALAGFPGYRIRIELRKYLPVPWITDIDLEKLIP